MLPDHLKIGYEVYRVSIGAAEFELQGECDHEHGTITLSRNATPRRLAAILMHEVLHACWDQAEMGDLGDDGREEQIVNRLASVLTQTLLDNPSLLRCLEAAAENTNSTGWKAPVCTGIDFPWWDMGLELRPDGTLEYKGNAPVDKADNERRNEQKRDCPASGYKCLTPEACKSFNVCCQLAL